MTKKHISSTLSPTYTAVTTTNVTILILHALLISSITVTAFSTPSTLLFCPNARLSRVSSQSTSSALSSSRAYGARECSHLAAFTVKDLGSDERKWRWGRKGIIVLQAQGQEGDDDDGWGTADTNTSADTNTNSNVINETLQKERELASLRSEITSKGSTSNSSPSSFSQGNDGTEVERDLFIPIFAVVSLLGLFGAYGYEMLRLYSRGELYLPWNS
mmetsp:Transcript_15943/g.20239  ORF Transcript_15943/g.20239 Transcript_15943/m.20239 type:complete len:217 (-) Transcript_15943:279-929(-)|eukprot:CAMPEP_0203659622 /NCGR_PEP_ID=MMETSP0088-20131115/52851_1 /ASSEMBLY_ACC=CAM_ASM_001087 /TAXON_ID=426623 /ORGANISM="Chaetoceros affinis, Strain CCMP159" /LENGTH=216 /DNA_ID=CAMNT_0050521723 /DNA_START=129 /DNA_END=779 /DNA_ORIENTATION=-